MAEKKKKPKFQRTKFRAYVKLGKGQKSKRKYRRATGRHNKTRQQWKSRPARVEIGYKNKADIRGLIKGKVPVVIKSIKDLKNIGEKQIAIVGKVGAKRKTELAKEAEKLKIEILNLNIKKFLRQIERRTKHKKKIKEERKLKKKKIEKKKGKEKEKKVEEKKQDEVKEESKRETKQEEKKENKEQ